MTLPRGLYGMVDTGAPLPPPTQLDVLLRAGCRVMQVRAKGESADARRSLVRALVPAARASGALLLVNDDIDAAAHADGVHLGQEDAPPAAARARLGPRALIGWSTHTAGQVEDARGAVDYIGFGPVFGTATKDTGYAPRGVAALADAVARFGGPVVAIGGIGEGDLPALQAAGAWCWAVIGGVWGAPDPLLAARRFASAGSGR